MKAEPIETFCLYGFIFEKFAYSYSDKPDAKSSPAWLHQLRKNQFGKSRVTASELLIPAQVILDAIKVLG